MGQPAKAEAPETSVWASLSDIVQKMIRGDLEAREGTKKSLAFLAIECGRVVASSVARIAAMVPHGALPAETPEGTALALKDLDASLSSCVLTLEELSAASDKLTDLLTMNSRVLGALTSRHDDPLIMHTAPRDILLMSIEDVKHTLREWRKYVDGTNDVALKFTSIHGGAVMNALNHLIACAESAFRALKEEAQALISASVFESTQARFSNSIRLTRSLRKLLSTCLALNAGDVGVIFESWTAPELIQALLSDPAREVIVSSAYF